MHDPSSASEGGFAGRDRVCRVVQGLLRGAQQMGWTDESLAAASGVPARTIKSYRVEGKEPSLSNALSLGSALGPAVVNGLLAVIGFGGARSLGEKDAIDPAQLVATVLEPLSAIASAAADGRIDHTERPAVERAADAIIATMVPISSAGRNG